MRNSDAPLIAEALFSYKVAGSERIGTSLAREFIVRGYRVVCFAVYESTGPVHDELVSAGIPVIDLNCLDHLRFVRRITYPLALRAALVRLGVSVLHVHHVTTLVACGFGARLAGVRTVLTEHDAYKLETDPSYRRQARFACHFADAVTVVHENMLGLFQDRIQVPRDKLSFIANSVAIRSADAGRRVAMRTRLGIPPDCFAVAYTGRLVPVKDVNTLITAFASMRSTPTEARRLLIVGDGPERARLESLVAGSAVARQVSFLGIRDDVQDVLSAADAFAMSSISEGQPLALLEAMGAALPVAATAVGGIPELLHGGLGLLVPPQDAGALRDALDRLARDRDEGARMGSRARQRIEADHNLQTAVDRYLAVMGLPPSWPPEVGAAPH